MGCAPIRRARPWARARRRARGRPPWRPALPRSAPRDADHVLHARLDGVTREGRLAPALRELPRGSGVREVVLHLVRELARSGPAVHLHADLEELREILRALGEDEGAA